VTRTFYFHVIVGLAHSAPSMRTTEKQLCGLIPAAFNLVCALPNMGVFGT